MKRNGHRSLESSASDSGRATLTNPRVLMPDEPCEGLATLVVRDVRDAIVALNREGMAIVPVEQKLSIPLASSIAFASSTTVPSPGAVRPQICAPTVPESNRR